MLRKTTIFKSPAGLIKNLTVVLDDVSNPNFSRTVERSDFVRLLETIIT